MTKWVLILVGLAIFAGVMIPVGRSQSDTEYRLAGQARDACYAEAGYGPYSMDPRPADLVRTCTQSIRDYEDRTILRIGLASLAGLLAALVYAFIVIGVRRYLSGRGEDAATAGA